MENQCLIKSEVNVKEVFDGLADFGKQIVIAIEALMQAAQSEIERAEREHLRAERLVAYKRRKHWRASDRSHLRSLGVDERFTMDLQGTGRPSVQGHRDLCQMIMQKGAAFVAVNHPKSTSDKRRQAFRDMPFRNHFIEALYRGEHSKAIQAEIPDPSVYAENRVGRAVGMSGSTVHKICGQIRAKRRIWEGAADFPPIMVAAYEEWMTDGVHPIHGKLM